MNFIDVCRKLISIDSSPSHGSMGIAENVAEFCQDLGFFVDIQNETVQGVDQNNVIIRTQKKAGASEFMLQSHLDTADPGAYGEWSKTERNPFSATIIDNVIYGLGAASVKLDLLCKIMAAKNFIGQSFKEISPCVVGTFGAESGGVGALKLLRKKQISCRRALVGEPTSLGLGHEGFGFLVIEISIPFSEEEMNYHHNHDQMESSYTQSKVFKGKAAHSSHPELGENAIVKMLTYLAKLPEGIAVMDLEGGVGFNSVPSNAILEVDIVDGFKYSIIPKLNSVLEAMLEIEADFKSYLAPGFQPPHSTLNLGRIQTFEDHVKMIGCARIAPSVSQKIYEAWMEKMRAVCMASGGTFRIVEYKPAFSTPLSSEFLSGCKEILSKLGISDQVVKSTSGSEASIFARMGVECLVFGPGQAAGNSHAPNECVAIEELRSAMSFYEKAIERFCK